MAVVTVPVRAQSFITLTPRDTSGLNGVTRSFGELNDLVAVEAWRPLAARADRALRNLPAAPASPEIEAELWSYRADGDTRLGDYGAAEAAYRKALALYAGTRRETSSAIGTQIRLADLFHATSRPELARQALVAAKTLVEVTPQALEKESQLYYRGLIRLNLSVLDAEQGQYRAAESGLRDALADLEYAVGSVSLEVATVYCDLGVLMAQEHRVSAAEAFHRQAVAIARTYTGSTSATWRIDLGYAEFLTHQGAFKAALDILRDLARRAPPQGADVQLVRALYNGLAAVNVGLGEPKEATRLMVDQRARDEVRFGSDSRQVAEDLRILGQAKLSAGDPAGANRAWRRALPLLAGTPGARSLRLDMARLAREARRFREARDLLEPVCGGTALHGLSASEDDRVAGPGEIGTCALNLTEALWANGAGSRSETQPRPLLHEAFSIGQQAIRNPAAEALARAGARDLAVVKGAGPEALAYESALDNRQALQAQLASQLGPVGQKAADVRASLLQRLALNEAEIVDLARQVKEAAPAYWLYRSNEAISLHEVQASDVRAPLLQPSEALVIWVLPDGAKTGFVFAATQLRADWAEIPLPGGEIERLVRKLRRQIDPCSYTEARGVCRGAAPRAFDTAAAHTLYQALLGDPHIQRVIGESQRLIIVPSGILATLPPGLLVVEPPKSPASDEETPDLTITPWLLRTKAVSIMPSVAALMATRRYVPADRPPSGDYLFALADPDLNARWPAMDALRTITPSAVTCGTSRGARLSPELADLTRSEALLDALDPLPCTQREAQSLAALFLGKSRLLIGPQATLRNLQALNDSGELEHASTLLFATHGLVAGKQSSIVEPALVLAGRGASEARLLTASRAARLRLNAEWVILSACDTAAPDASEGYGISGLARAFMFAGARAVVISQWQVRDDIASEFIPLAVASRNGPVSRAEAIRAASMAIADGEVPALSAETDPARRQALKGSLAHPAAWAAFTLVGV